MSDEDDVATELENECNHGIMQKSKHCFCYIGWSGEFCTEDLTSNFPETFLVWRVLFGCFAIFFTIYCGYTIFKSRTRYAVIKGYKRSYKHKWNLTSKKLIILLIFLLNLSSLSLSSKICMAAR